MTSPRAVLTLDLMMADLMETQWFSPPAAVVRYGVIDLPVQAVKVFVICMDKPGSDHNIIDEAFALDLARAVNCARVRAAGGEINAVVVCSAKKESFLVGADIEVEFKFVGELGFHRAYSDCCQLQCILCALEALPVPTVAVINGAALGGGLELALACDYRVASPHCSQIGLPEVKLGVLPGAGGCCRLPRLIGFKQSLSLLLTGKSISSHEALKQGIVDALVDETDTVNVSSEVTSSYAYKWLSEFVRFIKIKKIGEKPFSLSYAPKQSYCDVKIDSVSDDQIKTTFLEASGEYERKATLKYPRKDGRFYKMGSFIANMFFYMLALLQLWKTVGFRMPAPYLCLQTVFRCFYAGSWTEAMSLNAFGFALLCKTAESKNLMRLYLLTRKLKKFALSLGEALIPPGSRTSMDKNDTAIYCVVTTKCLRFSSSFVQGLIHSGFEVCVVDFHNNMDCNKFRALVRKQFDYSIRRGHLTSQAVKQKMCKLHIVRKSDIFDFEHSSKPAQCFLIDLCFWLEDAEVNSLRSSLCKMYSSVVQVVLVPALCDQKSSRAVVMNVGDPLRKNTLCVEISPASSETSVHDVRRVAALVTSLGKIPVVAPVAPLHSVAQYITLSHWARAVSLVADSSGRFTPRIIDSTLCSAGYSKGPFATMEELDPFCRRQTERLCGKISFNVDVTALRSYLVTGRIMPTTNGTIKAGKADISDVFNINLALTALKLRKDYPSVPPAAIDVLCVSGLTHFPPEEGGPFSYIRRHGSRAVYDQYCRLVHVLNFQYTFSLDELDSELSLRSEQVPRHCGYTAKQLSQMSPLSSNEMMQIGPVNGVQNQEVLLYPLALALLILSITFQCVVLFVWMTINFVL